MQCGKCGSKNVIEIDRKEHLEINDDYNFATGEWEQEVNFVTEVLFECKDCGCKFKEVF